MKTGIASQPRTAAPHRWLRAMGRRETAPGSRSANGGATATIAPRLLGSIRNIRCSDLCIPLLIATLWLATRPYLGVIHDSRFYTVQALNALMPGHFADDLYFRYGSQDEFTLFTLAYKPALAVLGLAKAALLMTIAGQVLWLAGLVYLASAIFADRKLVGIGCAMAIALPGGVIFSYGEQFVTPRLFAEAIVLFALGAMLRGRTVRAVILLGLSTMIHPIMTLPGIAAFCIYVGAGLRSFWILGALAVAASATLAMLGIQPFARLSMSFDPAWFDVVRVRDYFCLLAKWQLFDWMKLISLFSVAALGSRIATPREYRFLITVSAVAVGGLAVTFIGGDLLHNVLIVDAQQYRATWLLAVTANLIVGAMVLRIRTGVMYSLTRVALAFTVITLVVAAFVPGAYFIVAPLSALTAGIATWERRRNSPSPAVVRIVVIAIMALGLGIVIAITNAQFHALRDATNLVWQAASGLALTMTALASLAILMMVPAIRTVAVSRFVLALACGLVTVAFADWDQRAPWTRFIETAEAAPPSLIFLLPTEKPVYWEGDVRFPWFVLKQPNYFSCPQGTGSLFFRGTALAYQHRYASFEQLRTLDFGQETSCPAPLRPDAPPLDRELLASVCANEPELGALVLTRPVPHAAGYVWNSPTAFEDVRPIGKEIRVFRTNQFFIYPCADTR